MSIACTKITEFLSVCSWPKTLNKLYESFSKKVELKLKPETIEFIKSKHRHDPMLAGVLIERIVSNNNEIGTFVPESVKRDLQTVTNKIIDSKNVSVKYQLSFVKQSGKVCINCCADVVEYPLTKGTKCCNQEVKAIGITDFKVVKAVDKKYFMQLIVYSAGLYDLGHRVKTLRIIDYLNGNVHTCKLSWYNHIVIKRFIRSHVF